MRRLSRTVALTDLVSLIDGRLARGDGSVELDRLASLESADSTSIAVLSQARYQIQAGGTRAGAVVTSDLLADAVSPAAAVVSVSDPYRAYGILAREFAERLSPEKPPTRHPTAMVDDSALVSNTASLGAGSIVGANARVADGVRIGAGCVVGEGASLGVGVVLHPGVIVAPFCELGERSIVHSGTVIGSDGFGFARHEGRWEKIPQLGRVVIGTDVEIGSNCSIDRGALDDTVIGDGCKLDNLIQVAHNVQICEHTAIAACVGIAGSAKIGKRCMIGGAAGILGHLEVCDDVTISAMSLVTRSISRPGFYSGIFPLMDNADWERSAAVLRPLPDLRARLLRLESHWKES